MADDGHDLVLVARGAERLDAVATVLRARYGVAVETLAADLADAEGRAVVETRLAAAPPVDVLVSNAGVEVRQEFLAAALDSLQTEIDVNVSAVLRLTHVALTGMVSRGRGSVILVSSFAGILPCRGSAYGASRAWAVALADTLAPALDGTGVRITALCPGFVRTESLPGARGAVGVPVLQPDRVVRRALADHRAGRVVSTPGMAHRAVWTALDLPRRSMRLAARLAGKGRSRPPVAAVQVRRSELQSAGATRQPTP